MTTLVWPLFLSLSTPSSLTLYSFHVIVFHAANTPLLDRLQKGLELLADKKFGPSYSGVAMLSVSVLNNARVIAIGRNVVEPPHITLDVALDLLSGKMGISPEHYHLEESGVLYLDASQHLRVLLSVVKESAPLLMQFNKVVKASAAIIAHENDKVYVWSSVQISIYSMFFRLVTFHLRSFTWPFILLYWSITVFENQKFPLVSVSVTFSVA